MIDFEYVDEPFRRSLEEVLDPVARCFTPEVAREVAQLRADPKLQAHLDALAAKANEGELSEEARDEYAAYVEAIDWLSDSSGQG